MGRNSSALKHKVVDGEYDTTLFTAHAHVLSLLGYISHKSIELHAHYIRHAETPILFIPMPRHFWTWLRVFDVTDVVDDSLCSCFYAYMYVSIL